MLTHGGSLRTATVTERTDAKTPREKPPPPRTRFHSRLFHYLLLLRIASSWSAGRCRPQPQRAGHSVAGSSSETPPALREFPQAAAVRNGRGSTGRHS